MSLLDTPSDWLVQPVKHHLVQGFEELPDGPTSPFIAFYFSVETAGGGWGSHSGRFWPAEKLTKTYILDLNGFISFFWFYRDKSGY